MAELSTLGSVIKTAYEGEADTNAYSDAEKAKLGLYPASVGTDGQVLKVVSGAAAWADDSNTTYTAMSAAEATTGTATTARTISATVLAGAVAERLPAAASTAPAALAASSAVGTGTTWARADHVHAFPAQLATSRTIALTGGATASGSFNGSANLSLAVTLATPTGSVRGGVLQGAAVADATDETDVVAQFNALLASLRAAGVIAAS